MNATTQLMKDRLPKKDLLCPGEIAGAIGLATTRPILQAIKEGRISAAKSAATGRFVIAHSEAERYIDSTAYVPDEGTIQNEGAL